MFRKKFYLLFMVALWPFGIFANPVIKSLNPVKGPSSGGNLLTILGSGFLGTTSVKFDNTTAIYSIINDSIILATTPQGTPGLRIVSIQVGSSTSLPSRKSIFTYTQVGFEGILSVTNANTIKKFSTATDTINTTIPTPVPSVSATINPQGTTIYAIDTVGPAVLIVDAATNVITGSIALPPEVDAGDFDICTSPDGAKLYVSNVQSGYLVVINTSDNSIDESVYITTNLGSVSITPDGKTVFVTNFNFSFDNVTMFDTATNTIVGNLSTGLSPGAVSITPDNKKGFVGNSLSDTVSVIDIATLSVITNIALPPGSGPYGSAILPNGQLLYVGSIYNNTVTVIDVATNNIVTTIALAPGSGPFWLAATPDNKTVYVANLYTQDVTPINVSTNTALPNIPGALGQIENVFITPDPAPLANFSATPGSLTNAILFDASSSLSPIGTIALYIWDFGDGHTLTTTSPFASHLYTSQNFFNVTLRVVNSTGTSTAKLFSSRFMSRNGGPSAQLTSQVSVAPSPVRNLQGYQEICEDECGAEVSNVLHWQAPRELPLPASYEIFRDAALTVPIGIVPKFTFKFVDRHVLPYRAYTYYVVAVSANGTRSLPASVTIQPK